MSNAAALAPTHRHATPGMVVDVEVDERLVVTVPPSLKEGTNVVVTLLYKSGRRARLRISTDEEVAIKRPVGTI
jgi:hypothetical protein